MLACPSTVQLISAVTLLLNRLVSTTKCQHFIISSWHGHFPVLIFENHNASLATVASLKLLSAGDVIGEEILHPHLALYRVVNERAVMMNLGFILFIFYDVAEPGLLPRGQSEMCLTDLMCGHSERMSI